MPSRKKSTDVEIEAELVALGSFMQLLIGKEVLHDDRFADAARTYFDTFLGAVPSKQTTDDVVATKARERFLGYLATAGYAKQYLPTTPPPPTTWRRKIFDWLQAG